MTAQAAMPERIGRFHIRSMLGRGAMGIVYLGHDEEIDRLVAIKLIRADLLDTEEREGYLKRFRNEAKIAGRCMHANIVGLYDFAMHDENPYLVMEYVDGEGLQQFFPRGTRRPVHEVIHIALQVLDALHYAHGRSIVHRDIKPANILMMPDLSLKITDFGISRLTSMELTVTPLLIGTPSYMSPEQCLGSTLDGRNDLFSLGCVLYELVAGERAFAGVNYTETIFAIVNKPHVPLSQLRSDLPPGFSEAIDKALAKSPDQRHPDAASFARVLDDIARESRLPRNGMPPVIAEAGRLSALASPTMRFFRDASLRSRAHREEEAPPTVSVPMPQTAANDPVRVVRPVEEDADPTLKRTLRVRAPVFPVVPDTPPPATAAPDAVAMEPAVAQAPIEVPTPVADAPDAAAPVEPLAPDTPAFGAPGFGAPAPVAPAPVAPAPAAAAFVPPAPVPPVSTIAADPAVVAEPGLSPQPVPAAAVALPHDDALLHPAGAAFDAGSPSEDTVRHPVSPAAAPRDAVRPAPVARAAPVFPPRPARPPLPEAQEPAQTVSFVPGPHFALPIPLAEAERARIVDCLAIVLGPIAPLLARRAERPGMTGTALAEALSAHVRREDERRLFRTLLERDGAATTGQAAAGSAP